MKKILILLCGCLLLFTGIAKSQTWYLNMPDTVCMSTNSSTADQMKFTSMNVQLASNAASKANWTITTPNGTNADYNILYSERTSSVKDTLLNQTNLLTLQFLTAGKYTFTIAMTYQTGKNSYTTVTKTQSIVVVNCTISTCSGGDANMPGFTENFGTLPTNTSRMAYSPSSAITYIYTASGDPADNYYAISNSTHLKGDWITTNDHTGTSRGGMLVANSGYTPSTFFQKQVDGLCRGSVYNFSAWFINADSSLVMTSTCKSGFIYAGVTFQILNAANTSQVLASFRTYAVSPNFAKATWQRFGGSFTVPSGVSSVIVRIINNFPGGCGNDIAVDDIQFSYCSPIINASILGSASNLKEVLCEGVATTLVSSYTPTNYFTSPAYQWEMSDDGGVTWFNVPYGTANKDTLVIASGQLKGTKDVAADYLFRVRIFEAGSSSATCAAPSSSVKITILPMPVLSLTKSQVCVGGTVELEASGGYDYFKWSDTSYVGPDRHVTVLKDTTIKVYGYVTYGIDGGKTCVDSNSASIKKDDLPIVQIAASDTSLCLGSRLTLRIADALAPNGDINKSIRWYRGTSVATGTLLTDYNDQTVMLNYTTETLADTSFFVVVVSNTCTVTSPPFKIKLTEVPAPPAGTHVTHCVEDGTSDNNSFTMTRSLVTGTRGIWTVTGIDGPGLSGDTSATIDFNDYVTFTTSRNSPTSVITLNNPGITVYLQWTVTATGNTDCVGYAYDTLTLITGATRAYAGPDTTLCASNNVFTMQGNEPNVALTGDFAETGTWTLLGTPTGVTIDDIHAYNTTVRVTSGTYQDVQLAWTIKNASNCGNNTDTVVLHYTPLPTMTLKPDTVCNTLGYFEMDTVATSGNPTYYSVTGTMPGFTAVPETQISYWPITVPIPTGVANGVYTFTVNFRSDNGGCTGSTTIKVNVETPGTAPTGVTVGSPSICTSGTTTLTAVGGSLGKNADGTNAGKYVWYAGGCGTGTSIGTGASITVPVTATTTYYVRVESAGQCGNTACASGTVTVYTAPQTSNAGPAQTHCNDSLFTMAANPASVGAGAWTYTGTATITTTTSPTTTVFVPAGKTATLTWTITNGACTTASSVVLTNNMQPVKADAGPDSIKQCATTTFKMSATAASPATATGTWSTFAGSKATITAGQFNNPTATVTMAVGDTATLIWTVTNGTCSSTDYVKLFNYATPTTANAGVDTIKQCNTASFTMAATAPTVGIGKWSVKSGTATFATTDSSKINAVINVPVGTTATLTWTVANGTCSSTDDIVLINYLNPTGVDAGLDSIVQCNIATFTMAAATVSPATAVGTWSLFSGSKATIAAADIHKTNAVFTLAAGDTATAIWTVTNGVCSVSDYIKLKNYAAPTTADAGPAQVLQCATNTFTMAGSTPSVGVGTWTVSKATATITNPNSTTATITVPAGDSVMAYWTIKNGACSTVDSVKLVNYLMPTKANAGPDVHQCATPTFTMAANAASVGVGTWTKPAGSTATISGTNNPTTTVNLPTGDSTYLFWTITNGACTTTDTVWIVNNVAPAAANAGPDTIKQCNTAAFVMSANAPSVSGATGYWSVVSPATYTITAAQLTNPTTTFNVTAGQTVVLKWTISNTGCTTSDNIVLINYVQPTATSAGANQTHCSDSLFTVTGSTPMAGATGKWYLRGGTGTITSPASTSTTVFVPAGQTATLRWVITNGVCADSSTVTLTNYMQPVKAVAGLDSIKQCNTTSFTMNATAASPSTAVGTWSTFTGSKATITAGQFNNPKATVTLTVGDTATLIWTVTNGTCSSVAYVKLFNYATPTTADAGPDSVKQCMTPAFTMAATAPTVGTGKWSVKSGTATIPSTDSSKINAVITVANGTTAVLTWTVTNGTCSSTDDVTLVNYQSPGTANAGLDSIVQCNIATFTMAATTPTPATAVGVWYLPPGSKASIAAANLTKINAPVTLAAGDTATIFWIVTNGVCSSVDKIFLRNYQQPTTADAGPAQVLQCATNTFTMAGSTPSVGVGTWTVSKATATITNPNSTTATITVPAGDSVMAYWTIKNGTCSTVDSVKLVNYLMPTKANAGPDVHQCATPTFTMAANAASVGVGTWTKPAGSTATISSINNPTTTVNLPTGDSTYLFWTITNGACTTTDTVWIVNNVAPAAANAGPDTIKQCNTAAFVMSANAPSVSGATGYWSVVSPATYTITAAQLTNPTTTFNVTAGQTVVLKWTISNTGCTTSDNIVLINYVQPTATSAGANQTHCSDSLFTVTGSTPMAGATGKWYLRGGTGTITSPASTATTVFVPAGQTATLRWVITNGVCADSSTVTLTNYMQPVAANAGPDSILNCNTSTFTMSATAASPATATGTWSTFTGSKAIITAGMFNNPAATVTMAAGDTATLIWTVTNGLCTSSDYVKLYNYATPTTADAGPDTIKQCMTPAFTMSANTPAIGTGKWSVKSGTATIPSTDSSKINAVITVANGTTAVLTWTITNGTCSSKDDIVLVNYQSPGTANAGLDSIVQCNIATFTMAATTPTPATAVGVWYLPPGSKASIAAANLTKINAPVTLAAGDTATIFWIVTNGVCSSVDKIFLRNYQQPTTADAGPAQVLQCATNTFTMAGSTPSVGVGTWTVSKATATITNPNSTTATITVPAGDSVMAYWTIKNGTCSTVDSVKLVNYLMPTKANAGPDVHQCATPTFTMAANAASVGVGTWTKPAGSTATISSINNPTTTVNLPTGDSTYLFWTITNGACTTTDTVWIVNNVAPAAANAGPDTIKQCNTAAFVMSANAPSVSGATGYWSVVSPATYTITAAQLTNPTTTFNVTAGQTVVLKWTISNTGCTTSDNIVLINYVQPTATSAGANQTHCSDSLFTVTGSTPMAGATGKWYLRGGTGTITSPASTATTVFVPAGQTATLRWVITNGVCADSSTVTLTNYMQPVAANAGPDSILNCNTSTFTMSAAAASPATATGTWSTFTGSKATITAGMFNNPAATVTMAAGDTATLIWTVTNGLCTSSDYVKLYNYATPTTADAGPDTIKQCMTPAFTMSANTPAIGTGKWSVKSGTATIPSTDSSKINAVITVANGTTAVLTWTITNGTCSSKDDIVLVNYQSPGTANAGLDSIVQCNISTFTMAATTPTPATAVGVWYLPPGSKASIAAANLTKINAPVTLAAGDTATIFWIVTNGVCSSVDKIFLRNYQQPTTADAGPAQVLQCATNTFTMAGSTPSVGVGTWTVSKATATITNPNSTTATITVPAGDSVMAYWTIKNGTCSTVDSVKLVNYLMPTKANAGPDVHQCATPTFTMAANAASVGVGTWTKPAGSTATISSINNPTTTVNLPTGDSTYLFWIITNGACTTTDTVWIVNNVAPAAANAGPDTIKQCNTAAFVMSANAPSVSGATGYWSVVSPATYTITAAQLTNPTATFNVTAGQTVVLKWTISNTGCTTSDNIVLINYVQPTATSAGANQQHCNDSIFTVTGSAPMTGATGMWYVRSNNATITGSASATTTTVKVPAGQTATLRWVITNGVCADSSTVTLTNYMQPVAANAGPDSILNCNTSTFTMSATAASPATATGTWSTFTGSKATITAGMFNNPAATVTMAAGDTATLIWTVTNGLCTSSDYVKLYNYATPTTADAGPDTMKQCMTPAFTMSANTPVIGTGKWSVKSGTATIPSTDSSKVNAVITVANGTSAVLTWTITNGTCSSKDDIVLVNYQSPDPANAGLDSLVQCNTATFTMAATTPNPATAVGTWTLFTGSKANIAAADIHKINPVITLAAGDTATAIWTVTNGVCSSTDYIFLKNYQAPTTADAGPAQILQCATNTFTMAGSTPSVGYGTWTVSKATATITNPNSPTATITVPAGDSVIATWTIVNGVCSTADNVKLVNYVKPADADAGPDQHQCNTATFTMAANAPSETTASGAWSKPAGSTATIASINSPTTTVTIPVGDSSMLFWTITNGVCSDVDTVWIVNNNPPAAADAGVDTMRQCNTDAFTMTANAPSVAGATGYWSVVSPASYTIPAADVNNPAATFTVTAGSTVVLSWTITNLGCTTTDNIVLINYEQPTAVTAGPDQTKCAGSAFVLDGSAPNVAGAIGTWYVRNGLAVIATGEEHNINAHVTLPNDASAELHWVVTNGVCADSASVILTNYLTPAKADAGADLVKHCSDSAFVMNANAPDVTGAIGEWTFVGTTTATVTDANDPLTTIFVPAGDSVLAIWSIGNGTCSTSDTVKLVNYMSPTAAAVPADMLQCMTTTFPVTANAPDVPGAIGYWTVVKGNATFPATDINNNSTTFTVANGDSAYISWTLTNGVCISADTIKLYNFQQPAQADAGADSLVQCNTTIFTMAATAPNLATAVGKWSLYPGSAASFSAADSSNINTVFNLPVGDTATAIWTVTNGVCSSYDVIMLKNYEAPAQADAGPDSLRHCNDAVFVMSATAPNLPTAIGTWTVSKTTATISDIHSITATINVPAGDSVIATWTVTNGVCSTADNIKLVNYQQPTAAAAGTDTHQCATSTFTLAGNTPDVAGAVGTWTLPAGSTATIATTEIHKPNAVISVPEGDSVIATWTITNGVCTSSSTVKLVNDKMPDVANAGTAQTHCADSAFVMAANAPSVASAIGTWTFYAGSAATVATADLNNPTATIFVPAGDTATAIWTITNTSCATSSTVFLRNDMMPEAANAGANQVHCNDSAFIMTATPGAIATSVGTWTVISGVATIAAADLHNPTAKVIVFVNTSATLQWTLSNGTCTGTPATVTLTNLGPVLGNTISADQTVCATETPAALKGTTTLSGGDGTFSYQWQISTTSATTGFTNVTTGTGGTAANYTPATLTADSVWFRRIVTSGACSTTLSNVVKIRRITTNPVVVSVPAAITTDCVLGKDYTTMFGTPVFSHMPFSNEALTVTYRDDTQTPNPCTTIIMRTWTAVDRCGLSTSAQQTITVVDNKAPVFTTAAPADVTVECDKVPAAVNLTANDACTGLLTIAPIETRIDMAGQCSSNYYLVRKWVAVDNCGNASDTLKQTITVRDLTAPVFTGTAPANVTVDCDKVPAAAPLTATDNCTPGTITVNPVDTRQSIAGAKCSNTYQITRTWTAADNCGNTTILKQIITVQDTTRPAFSMTLVSDTTVNCDAVPAIPTITATDNCSASVKVSVSQTKVFLSTTCSNNYRLTRTWTASDDCGNTATMKQVITVQDTTKPTFTFTPPADTTVSCSAVPTPPTNLSATDNCTATSNVKISYSQTRQSITGSCASNYQLIRVWTAKDECGNTNIVRQIITVVDTTRPVIDPAPAAVTVSCGGTIPAAATLYATDNCDGNFPKKATMTTDPYTVDACNGYTITRRWNISDACGNAAIERVQIITVTACPKPTLDATLPVNCSDNTKFALQLLTKVNKPTFTLQSVYPAGIVTTPKSQTSNVFDLNGATQATFIVTDGVTGCVSDPVTYTLQYVTKPTVNLGADVAICEGNSVTLDAGAANASAGYTIKWSTGATTQQITVSNAGTYYATVTNNGCTTTDTIKVTVNKPPTVVLNDITICDGATAKLNAYVQGASYIWSTGDTGPSIEVSTTGTYTVDVSLNGCTVTAQATVTVATPPNVTVTPDTSVCPDQTVMLQVEPDGGSVKWSDGSLTNSIVVSKPGAYWVTVTKNSCVVTDTIHVTNKANINLDLGPDKDICAGGLVVLNATNPDAISYLWNDGTTDPIKEVSTPGMYTVTVLDKNCNLTSSASVKVTVAGIGDISLGNDTAICIGQTLTLRVDAGSGNSIRWQDGVTTSTYVVTATGYYKVTVYNDCGSVSDDITVTYKQCEAKPQFPNAFTPNGDGNNDKFKPHVTGPMYDYDLRVFNRWGQVVFLSKDQNNGWDGRFNGALVDVGTYVWLLSYKNAVGGETRVIKGEVTVIR